MPGPWLTTVTTAELDLGIGVGDDARLQRFIEEATRVIESFAGRDLSRALQFETFRGSGFVDHYVQRRPLIEFRSATYDGIAEADSLFTAFPPFTIINENGYTKSSTALWVLSYLGGYLVRGQDLAAVATISTLSTDNSFNDSAGSFPLLGAGETFVVSGMPTHNGTFTTTGVPTASKIPVTATLGDEGPAASATLIFSNQPSDLERACLDLVGLIRSGLTTATGALKSFRLGPFEESFDTSTATGSALSSVRDLIEPYRRLL